MICEVHGFFCVLCTTNGYPWYSSENSEEYPKYHDTHYNYGLNRIQRQFQGDFGSSENTDPQNDDFEPQGNNNAPISFGNDDYGDYELNAPPPNEQNNNFQNNVPNQNNFQNNNFQNPNNNFPTLNQNIPNNNFQNPNQNVANQNVRPVNNGDEGDDLFVFETPEQAPITNNNNNNNRGNQQRPAPTPTAVTTPGPDIPGMGTTISSCETACRTTNEYNPVCGDDGLTYFSRGRLDCARNCGKRVQLSRLGQCTNVLRFPMPPPK